MTLLTMYLVIGLVFALEVLYQISPYEPDNKAMTDTFIKCVVMWPMLIEW